MTASLTLVSDISTPATTLEPIAQTHDPMIVISRALQVLTQQLPKTAEIVEQSTQELSARFVALADGTRQQGEQVNLVVQAAGTLEMANGETISMQDFTLLFTQTLNDSIDKILSVSKHAMAMVYELDKAMLSLQEIGQFVRDIEHINKQSHLLALNAAIEASRHGKAGESFRVVADEVKGVSDQVRGLAKSMKEKIHTISASVTSGFNMLNDVATTDMSSNILAREKLQQLLECMVLQHERFSLMLRQTAAYSQEISKNISGMVVGMQFQDRTKQYIENSVRLLNLLIQVMSQTDRAPSAMPTSQQLHDSIAEQFSLGEFRDLFHRLMEGEDVQQATIAANAHDDDIEFF